MPGDVEFFRMGGLGYWVFCYFVWVSRLSSRPGVGLWYNLWRQHFATYITPASGCCWLDWTCDSCPGSDLFATVISRALIWVCILVYVWGFDSFILILYGFEGVCDCGSGRKISGSSIMSEMYMNIWWCIGCTHNMNKSSSWRFKFVGYYTVDPQ